MKQKASSEINRKQIQLNSGKYWVHQPYQVTSALEFVGIHMNMLWIVNMHVPFPIAVVKQLNLSVLIFYKVRVFSINSNHFGLALYII